MSVYDQVINANLIIERFGEWPSFHDAEVRSVVLTGHRPEPPLCEMVIHAWLMTNQVDARGYYMLERHTLVTFRFEGLLACEFRNFNHQNCLSSMWIEMEIVEGCAALRVQLPTNYGLESSVLCKRVIVAGVQSCDERGEPQGEG